MGTSYGRLSKQCNFKYQIVFSAKFDRQDEYEFKLEEIELWFHLCINPNSSHKDIHIIILRFQLEHQKLNQHMEDSGWRFDETFSMTKFF